MAHLRGGGVGVVPRGDEWGGLKTNGIRISSMEYTATFGSGLPLGGMRS